MKKLIILLLTAFCISCNKEYIENDNENDFVTVSFLPQIESGNILTRSQFSDEVLDNLEYDIPSIIYLYSPKDGSADYVLKYTLNLKDGNQFSVQKGTYAIQISSGEYEQCKIKVNKKVPFVVGWNAVSRYTKPGMDPAYYYRTARITIDESKQYTIPIYISGILFACKKSEASYFNCGGSNSQETENYYYQIITLGLACSKNDIGFAMGESDNYEYTSYTSTWGTSNCGKYYILSPNEKEYNTFGLLAGGWEYGNGNED